MLSTNTGSREAALTAALAAVPDRFRKRIVAAYLELRKRYAEARYDLAWDTSGLSAGKFCEATLRFLQQQLTGGSTPFGQHIPNFADECRKLVALPRTAGHETLRVIIPRALGFLYTLRGKRGIGHVGGDVEPNRIDAETVVRVSDWILCELIRIFHKLSLEEAQALVDAVAQRTIPDVWEVAGRRRVLRQGLNYQEKTLLLLYSSADSAVLAEDLFAWTDHSNFTLYKRDVLAKLHRNRLIEYDRESAAVYISPLGTQQVEGGLLSVKA